MNLANGELRNLSEASRNSLVKAAGFVKEAAMLSWLAPTGKALFNYGVPVASGVATGYAANQAGADVTTSTAAGLGGMAISSPRRWRDILNESQAVGAAGKDPFHAFYRNAIKDVGIKAGITGGVALGDNAYKISKNLLNTTDNAARFSKPFADQAGKISKNLLNTTDNAARFSKPFADQAGNLATNSATSLHGIQDSLNDVSAAAYAMQNSAEASTEALKNLPEQLSMSPATKALIGTGIASTVGGGILLHHLLKQHAHKKQQGIV